MHSDLFEQESPITVADSFNSKAEAVLVCGETLETLRGLPEGCAKLVISSPPYNIGKEYEARKELEHYLETLGRYFASWQECWPMEVHSAGRSAITLKIVKFSRWTCFFIRFSKTLDYN